MNSSSVLSSFGFFRALSTRRFASVSPQFSFLNVKKEFAGVYNVELNRPKSRNSLNLGVWNELKAAFDYLHTFKPCRAIVLSGNGQSFCSGIDLNEGLTTLIEINTSSELDCSRKAFDVYEFILKAQEGFDAIENCKKPVIAAIQGHCYGAGISMVSCCDVRYAVNDAHFSIKEPDVGLAADVGILQRIQKIVGNDSWIREIAFTARGFSGDEALKQGFVSRTMDNKELCLSSALELATEIASKSPVAVYGTKKALNYSRDHSIADSLEWMRVWNQAHLQTEDIYKIAQAKINKKKPEFNDV